MLVCQFAVDVCQFAVDVGGCVDGAIVAAIASFSTDGMTGFMLEGD